MKTITITTCSNSSRWYRVSSSISSSITSRMMDPTISMLMGGRPNYNKMATTL